MTEIDCISGVAKGSATWRRHSVARGQSVLTHRLKVLGMGRTAAISLGVFIVVLIVLYTVNENKREKQEAFARFFVSLRMTFCVAG